MSEPRDTEQIRLATDQNWAAYNRKMADLFTERNACALDSPERTAVAERILALWVKCGG
jgi:hypothetical protein